MPLCVRKRRAGDLIPMADDNHPQEEHTVRPEPAGAPQPESTLKRRRIIIAGVVITIIVIVIFLPWIVLGIYALFFGSPGGCGCTRVVAATVKQPDNGTIVLIYHGGQSEGLVVGMTVNVTDSTGHVQSKTVGYEKPKRPFALRDYLWFWDLIFPLREREPPTIPVLPVGQEITFTGPFSGQDHVTANVIFLDQTEQVILDCSI
jgi:hypothetical protein